MSYPNRETWLIAATSELRDTLFKRHAETVPEVKVSVGFPGGGSARKRIGECWNGRAASDGMPQVFISPVLADPVRVLDVLVHELIHAIVPDAGHKTPFKRIATKLGLTGKMTATVAGPELEAELRALSDRLGAFPHAGLTLSGRKKQTTRLNKVECPDCGYTCRVTSKWLEDAGAPICPCNQAPMSVV